MTESSKAVFLSYASQDAEAARRICESLRAASIEVGIAFILREIFIGLYDHSIDWPQVLALAALLAVLVSTRIATVLFQPADPGANSGSACGKQPQQACPVLRCRGPIEDRIRTEPQTKAVRADPALTEQDLVAYFHDMQVMGRPHLLSGRG